MQSDCINQEVLARLQKTFRTKQKFCGYLDTFLEHVPRKLERAQTGLKDGEMPAVQEALHSILSSAGTVGAQQLEDLTKRGLELAQENAPDKLTSVMAQMAEAYGDVDVSLRRKRLECQEVPLVAVVEDNPDNRLLVRAILEDHYEIVEYESARAALDGFEVDAPDLILLDVSLPGMDGAELLRRLRDNPKQRHIPVIALTAHAMFGDREKFLNLGFDDYVAKPIVDENFLLDAIRKCLTDET